MKGKRDGRRWALFIFEGCDFSDKNFPTNLAVSIDDVGNGKVQ